ncbi:unnamed protein product, partial [Rhizoctonia solani]
RDRWQKDEPLRPCLPTRAPMTIRIHHPPFDMLLHFLGILPSQGIPNVLDIELALDRQSITHPGEEEPMNHGLILLLPLLQKSHWIGSLILENTQPKVAFSGTVLRFMLEALPTLHTLTLENFELTESTLRGLTRPVDPDARPNKQPQFPALEVLRLQCSRILDSEAFKHMIASHPIRITALCLERSRESLINASVHLPSAAPWRIEGTLALHTHRIHSLYVSSRKVENIRSIMECILSCGVPRSLKHLSIKAIPDYRYRNTKTILSPSSHKLQGFHGLVNQLHTLCLRGVFLAPESYSFNGIRDVAFDADSMDIIRILATGHKVRSIEVRNLLSGDKFVSPTDLPVTAKRLKRLCLAGIRDLAALCNVLRSIPQGSYKLELTIHVVYILWPNNDTTADGEFRDVDMLGPLLHRFDNITALTLASNQYTPSRSPSCENLHKILRNLSHLCYLNLEGFHLTQELSAAMTRQYDQESTCTASSTFPILRKLRLWRTRIADYEAFKAMVFSHKIHLIRISHCMLQWDGDNRTLSPSSSSPLYKWLCMVVPIVSIVG